MKKNIYQKRKRFAVVISALAIALFGAILGWIGNNLCQEHQATLEKEAAIKVEIENRIVELKSDPSILQVNRPNGIIVQRCDQEGEKIVVVTYDDKLLYLARIEKNPLGLRDYALDYVNSHGLVLKRDFLESGNAIVIFHN